MYGKQAGAQQCRGGRQVGCTRFDKHAERPVDFAATIRTAAPWQSLRRTDGDIFSSDAGSENKAQPYPTAIRIHAGDVCRKKYVGRGRCGVFFVVDASRSQGQQKRLAFAKGAVFSLLKDVYCMRHKAALITFGNKKAEFKLPLTKSVEYAKKCLETIPAAGNTPLAMGLRKALSAIEEERKKDPLLNPVIVVLTDGKANYDELAGNPLELSAEAAAQIKKAAVPAVVVDTDCSIFNLGLAKQLAEKMDAYYMMLV